MWKANMNLHEAAGVIECFLEKRSLYPQEWNDFIDSSQDDWVVDAYKRSCHELDPLISHPGEPCPGVAAIWGR